MVVGTPTRIILVALAKRSSLLMQNDAKIAMIARSLAEALQDWAYTRKDEDKKRVTAGQTELVQAVKEEADARPPGA